MCDCTKRNNQNASYSCHGKEYQLLEGISMHVGVKKESLAYTENLHD